MRTTVTIEVELYTQALEVIDPAIEKPELFREALHEFVRVESAKRLAALGGKAPTMTFIPAKTYFGIYSNATKSKHSKHYRSHEVN